MSLFVNREEKNGRPFLTIPDRTDLQPLVIKVPPTVTISKLMALTIVAVMGLLAIGVEYLNATDQQTAWGLVFIAVLAVYFVLFRLVLHQRTKILDESDE